MLRVQRATFKSAQKGILKLGLSSSTRDGYIFVPSQYDPANANAMILAIHAAGRAGLDALQLLVASANSSGEAPELLFLNMYVDPSCSCPLTTSALVRSPSILIREQQVREPGTLGTQASLCWPQTPGQPRGMTCPLGRAALVQMLHLSMQPSRRPLRCTMWSLQSSGSRGSPMELLTPWG